jgi:hypothetical protein
MLAADAASEVSVHCAFVESLQAPLGPLVGYLVGMGYGLAFGDERFCGVPPFGTGAVGLREFLGGGEFVAAGRGEAGSSRRAS